MARLILTRDNKTLKTLFLTGSRMWIGNGPECDIRIQTDAPGEQLASITHRDKRYVLSSSDPDRQLQVNHGYAETHDLVDGDVIHLGAYKLLFTESGIVPEDTRPAGRQRTAYLKVMGGKSRGRVIRLTGAVTRFGKTGSIAVMISRRSDGYYLSHLEGKEFPRVNHTPIGEDPYPLNDADTIEIDTNTFEFCTSPDAANRGVADCGPATPQQRHFTRVALDVPATLGNTDRGWETHLVDLSLNGVLVAHPAGWSGKKGDHSTLTLHMNNKSDLALQVVIRQIHEDRIGMAFTDMDARGREEIRWLVKLNLADSALLERELSELF
jgi:pSer/pThr/pTyr-binding forkhead associated (FHA) protein